MSSEGRVGGRHEEADQPWSGMSACRKRGLSEWA